MAESQNGDFEAGFQGAILAALVRVHRDRKEACAGNVMPARRLESAAIDQLFFAIPAGLCHFMKRRRPFEIELEISCVRSLAQMLRKDVCLSGVKHRGLALGE